MAFENKKVLPPNSDGPAVTGNTANQAPAPAETEAAARSRQAEAIKRNMQATAPDGTNRVSQHVDMGLFGGSKEVYDYSAKRVDDPNYDKNKQRVDSLADTIGARRNETMEASRARGESINASPQAQMRNAQSGLIGQLQQASSGEGPSAAQQQLKTGADRAMASNLAMAAAGGTPGARRQAAFANAAATQDLAGQSAVLRANEINSARSQLGQVSSDARGQDIGLATNQAQLGQQNNQFNAGLTQDANKTNLLSGIEQQKQRDDLVRQYTAAGLSLDEANRQAEIQQRQFNASLGAQQEAAKLGVSSQAAQGNAQAAGAGAQAAGAILAGVAAAASDERVKKNVHDGDREVENFLDSLDAKGFEYKDPAKHGAGARTGVMAQDVEKSRAGDAIVSPAADGTKMLDINKSVSMSLAALANLNKRLRSVGA